MIYVAGTDVILERGREVMETFECHRARYTALLHARLVLFFKFFISPLFNQVGKLRTSSHLQLRPGQDKAKQFDTYNDTELHMEKNKHTVNNTV